MKSVYQSIFAKAFTMVLGVSSGVYITRLTIQELGTGPFALYALLTTIPALLPFLDLGTGAVVVNAVSSSPDPKYDKDVSGVITSVLRIATASAAVLLMINTLLFTTGQWQEILGPATEIQGRELTVFLCVTLFAAGIPLSLGQRILLGKQKYHIQLLLQGLQGPLTALLLWFVIRTADNPSSTAALAFYVSGFIVSVVAGGVAVWMLYPATGTAVRGLLSFRRIPQHRVMDTAMPMLFQLVSVPIATQAGRLMLSHRSTEFELVSYSLGAQVFFSLQAIIATAGVALWPIFAKAGRGDRGPSPITLSAMFFLFSLILSLAILMFRAPIFNFLSAGEATVDLPAAISFSLALCFQAALYPLGMFLTDKRGLRFQVLPTLAMVVTSLALCFWLTPFIGAAAPPLSVALGIACFQLPAYCSAVVSRRRVVSGVQSN